MSAKNRAQAPGTPNASAARRVAALENTFDAFFDRTIETARNLQNDSMGSARLMTEMNQVITTLQGLGVVMRIVTANGNLQDNYDPEDPESEPPLSPFIEGSLTGMVASVCELLVENISATADYYNGKVKS